MDEIREIYVQLALQGPLVSDAPDSLLSESPVEQMEGMIESLTNHLMNAFDAAALSNSPTEITNLFKLFPVIKKVELGLDKLSAYVCTIVSSNINQGMKRASETSNKSVYLDCLVSLFEAVASMIDRQEQIVEFHYGTGF